MHKRFAIATFAAWMLLAHMSAAQADEAEALVSDTATASFEAAVERARAEMMAAPDAALNNAEAAETFARGIIDFDARNAARLTAWWLQSEALTRLGRPVDARPVAERALARMGPAAESTKLHADLLTSNGRAARLMSDYAVALESFHGAFEIYRALGEARSEAIALQSIGSIYFDAGQHERAIAYYEDALERYPGDVSLDLAAFNNIAIALDELGRRDEAIEYYRRSYEIALRLESPLLETRILNNIAALHVAMGDFEAAEATLTHAFERAAAADGTAWTRFLWGVRAQAALAQGDHEAARMAIERTFADTNLSATTFDFVHFHEAAAEIYAELGRWRSAFEHQRAFKRLDDEARDVAASANTALMGAQFDFTHQELQIEQLRSEQLEQEIALDRSQARMRMGFALAAGLTLLAIAIAFALRAIALHRAHEVERRANERLRRMNEKLTSAEAELQKALIVARSASKAKSAFLSNMSHELRTPLNAIIGFAELMRQESLGPLGSEEYVEYADMIGQSGAKLLKLVVAVLQMAALDEHDSEKRASAVFAVDIADDAVEALENLAKQRGVSLVVRDEAADKRIRVEAEAVRKALSNVLDNAVRFSPEGENVDVKLSVEDEHVRICVVDRGCGMNAETRARVGRPFEKGDMGATTAHEGLGLGLALAKALVEANRGHFEIISALGEGTTVVMTFAALGEAAPSDDARQAA